MRYLCNGGSRERGAFADTEVAAESAREAAERSVARGDWGAVTGEVRVIVTRPDGTREWYRVRPAASGVQAGGYWPGEVARP